MRPAATLVSAVHPGAVVTELPRYIIGRFPMILQQVMLSSMKYLGGAGVGVMWDSDTAALSQVFAMSAPKASKDPEKYHGKFIVPLARISTPPAAAENATLQAQLWEFTEALIAQKVADIDGSYSEQGSTKLLRFAVTHMGCVTCEVDITNIIQEQPGVSSGSVDYYSGLANVRIDPGKFDVAKLRAALEYAGYGLEEDLALAETHLKKTQEQLAEEAATADAELAG